MLQPPPGSASQEPGFGKESVQREIVSKSRQVIGDLGGESEAELPRAERGVEEAVVVAAAHAKAMAAAIECKAGREGEVDLGRVHDLSAGARIGFGDAEGSGAEGGLLADATMFQQTGSWVQARQSDGALEADNAGYQIAGTDFRSNRHVGGNHTGRGEFREFQGEARDLGRGLTAEGIAEGITAGASFAPQPRFGIERDVHG